jgi:alpha-amylase/alpha-mannosidase (GH57 family)
MHAGSSAPGPAVAGSGRTDAAAGKLRVVLCWHMHQPQYRDCLTGEFLLPWTYLHGIKDYVDMAQHIEAVPGAMAVVNFSPVLLEQLDDYSVALGAWLRNGQPLPDPLLAVLADGLPADRSRWPALVRAYLRANREHLVDRFPPYRELAARAAPWTGDGAGREPAADPPMDAADEQFLLDLAVWYHLAWFGESVRRGDPRAQQLLAKERHYDAQDRRLVLEVVADVLAGLVPRYRRLMGTGQVELSVTPWGHPIVPLLLDFNAAREQMPDAPLPRDAEYPDGEGRARWHVARAIQEFTRAFGVRPRGCWPSEGAVSTATLRLLDSFGFDWIATGEGVLRASLEQSGRAPSPDRLHVPYTLPEGRTRCFFRHEQLSDLIGFTYSKWHGDDAVANFVHHLETLATQYRDDPSRTIAVILDGENAWEHYPYNGWYFLRGLYERLADHPTLRLSTFSQALHEDGAAGQLTELVAGSWVHGTLSTWIGSTQKNRAWEMLCDAKRTFDQVVVEGGLTDDEQRRAEIQLGVCEGSDWAWWFGDYNPAGTVATFDTLYRRHLTNLYRLLEEAPPDYLRAAFATGGGDAEQGGTMRRAAT